MVLLLSKVPSISSIFERKNGNYTSKALLYQDMILYSLVLKETGRDNSFKVWDLAGWLVDHNSEFLNSNKDPSSRNISRNNRIENKLDRIKKYVAALCSLQIMKESGMTKAAKVVLEVPRYSYTFYAYLLGYIIRCEGANAVIQNVYNDKILELWQHQLARNNSSIDIYTSNLFNKFKEKGVFGSLVVERLIQQISSGILVENMTQLIDSLGNLNANEEKVALFLELWSDTWDELDHSAKQILLHCHKLDLEQRMYRIVYDVKEYEKFRFELRNDAEVLALEALCRNCGTYNYVSVQTIPYLRRKKVPQSGPKTAICIECNTKKVEIPSL